MNESTMISGRDVRQRALVPPERLARCDAVVIGVGAIESTGCRDDGRRIIVVSVLSNHVPNSFFLPFGAGRTVF
jgi:hypothetical protein